MGTLMDTLERAMAASGRRDIAAYLDCLTDDIEYKLHVNARPLNGKAWIERFLRKYWDQMTDTEWRIDRYAENGNVLMVEGVEVYTIKATGQKVVHPYMGICEFRDGRIAKMRDYFEMDPPELTEQALASGAIGAAGAPG
jgi:limonene-1,2-epoxide hydrolase